MATTIEVNEMNKAYVNEMVVKFRIDMNDHMSSEVYGYGYELTSAFGQEFADFIYETAKEEVYGD